MGVCFKGFGGSHWSDLCSGAYMLCPKHTREGPHTFNPPHKLHTYKFTYILHAERERERERMREREEERGREREGGRERGIERGIEGERERGDFESEFERVWWNGERWREM